MAHLDGSLEAHPTAKRGAQNTEPGVKLDYLRGTLPAVVFNRVIDSETGEAFEFAEPPTLAIESLLGEMTPLEHNMAQGYTHSAVLPCGGTVHWHEKKPEQRVLINLGGQALGELGRDPLELIDELDRMSFQPTRTDWALDDLEGLLDLETITQKVLAGEMVTRFKGYGFNVSGKIGDQGQDQGRTIYIGDRKSESFMRIYDKAAEQGLSDVHHIRVEVEVKKRKAQALWADILAKYRIGESVSDLILGVIYGLVDFKEPDSADTNKSRWATCDWWAKFLGVGEKVKVVIDKAETTLERAKDWFYGQVGIVAAMINELDPDFISQALDDGLHRMKERHRLRFDRWAAEFGESVKAKILDFQAEVAKLPTTSPGSV